MFYLISKLEAQHIADILQELSAIADASEFSKEEVQTLIDLIGSLKPLNTDLVVKLTKEAEEANNEQ